MNRSRSGGMCACLIVAVVLMTACTFTDTSIPLPNARLDNPVTGGKGRRVVVVMPFRDERGEVKVRCGSRKGLIGFGLEMGDALCESDPTMWIAELLAAELRAAGFEVLAEQQQHEPGALRIEGSLYRLFVDPKPGRGAGSLEADLSVELHATTDTGLDSARLFFVKGWKGGVVVISTQPYVTSLHRATQTMLEEMVRAVVELMDRYPQLGSSGASGIVLSTRLEEELR